MTFTKQQIRVGNNRLLKLAAFLRELPRNRFDYNRWVGETWKGKKDLSCGTTACALGWATTMPSFRRLGLYLDEFYEVSLKGDRDSDSFEAASKVFYIYYDDAEYLFRPSEEEFLKKVSAKCVAKKIEKFVTKREKELAES